MTARAIAAAEHIDPFGKPVRVSRNSLDRWIRAWRAGGFDALVPSPRQSSPRTPPEVIELALGLNGEGVGHRRVAARLDVPAATARPWLRRARQNAQFGRFEATRPNELWTGDALHGPRIAGRKTYLSVTWNHSGEWILILPVQCGPGCAVEPANDDHGEVASTGSA